MQRKYLVAVLCSLLITCLASSLFVFVLGDEQSISYVFSDDEHQPFDFQSLNFSLFVSPDGSDSNSGTEDRPFETISKAAETAQAGDVVFVARGTYREFVTTWNSGTKENLIHFVAEEGVVVEGPANLPYWGGIFQIDSRSYITISGFHLKNSNWFGIMIQRCSHITIDSCFVENTEASGIWVHTSDHILINNNKVRNACAYTGDPNVGSQECISIVQTHIFQVIYNEVYESSSGFSGGEGIDTKEGCSQGEVAYNIVHDNIRLGIYVDSWDAELSGISVHSNLVYNNYQGIAVSSENGGTVKNVTIYNNLVVNNSEHGIVVSRWVVNGPRENINIISNTVVNNGDENSPYSGGIAVQPEANAYNITIRNNIVSDNKFWQIMADYSDKGITCDHNLINGFRGYQHETKGNDYLEGDPGFVGNLNSASITQDSFPMWVYRYALRRNSIAIDSGSLLAAPSEDILGNKRPQGTAIDIGAFEYSDPVWNWTWTRVPDMPTKRNGIAAATVDGKIYVLGGGTSLEEYDPITNTWRRQADMPINSWAPAAAVVNGKIYSIGGRSGDSDFLATVQMYNPATNTWASRSPMLTARERHAAAVVNGKIYVFGGFDENWNWLNTVEEYDPATDTWTPRTPMPTPTTADAVAVGEIIYVIGYNDGVMMEYDPDTDTWTPRTPIPTVRTGFAAAAVEGRLYVVGGQDKSENYLATVEEYDQDTDMWITRTPMPSPRGDELAAVAVSGRLYVIGGRNGNAFLGTVEVYGPPPEIIPPETTPPETTPPEMTPSETTPPETTSSEFTLPETQHFGMVGLISFIFVLMGLGNRQRARKT